MTIEISPNNERYIEAVVQTGEYRNRSQVVDEALDLLRQRDALRNDVNAGVEQLDRGEGIPADEVFERLANRVQEIGNRHARNQ